MKMQTTRSTLGSRNSRTASWPTLQAAPVTWESGVLAHREDRASLSLFRPRRLPLGHPHRQPVW